MTEESKSKMTTRRLILIICIIAALAAILAIVSVIIFTTSESDEENIKNESIEQVSIFDCKNPDGLTSILYPVDEVINCDNEPLVSGFGYGIGLTHRDINARITETLDSGDFVSFLLTKAQNEDQFLYVKTLKGREVGSIGKNDTGNIYFSIYPKINATLMKEKTLESNPGITDIVWTDIDHDNYNEWLFVVSTNGDLRIALTERFGVEKHFTLYWVLEE